MADWVVDMSRRWTMVYPGTPCEIASAERRRSGRTRQTRRAALSVDTDSFRGIVGGVPGYTLVWRWADEWLDRPG